MLVLHSTSDFLSLSLFLFPLFHVTPFPPSLFGPGHPCVLGIDFFFSLFSSLFSFRKQWNNIRSSPIRFDSIVVTEETFLFWATSQDLARSHWIWVRPPKSAKISTLAISLWTQFFTVSFSFEVSVGKYSAPKWCQHDRCEWIRVELLMIVECWKSEWMAHSKQFLPESPELVQIFWLEFLAAPDSGQMSPFVNKTSP